jgi:hypothetical protein
MKNRWMMSHCTFNGLVFELDVVYDYYAVDEVHEALIVEVSRDDGDVATAFEDSFQPQLHLLAQVEFLQVVD